nr:growth factor receptor-bound protein 10 isoform X5 [Oryctolagus cuniculus]
MERMRGRRKDDDLEKLVNDMNTSLESLYSACSNMQSDTVPLLQNGQHTRSPPPAASARPAPPQKVQRSQPVHILAVSRRLQDEDPQFRTSSLPAIPNPFPELSGPGSSPVLPPASLPPSQPVTKQDVKVFSEDGTSKVVEILTDMTARDLCQLLIYRSHCVDDNSWTLVEHHPHLGLERCLEDHELVVQVEGTMGSEGKFLFRKNYAKYEFFRNPVNFFPEQMVTWCQQSNGSHTQLLQNFLNASSCPEIQGFLHVKELGRKSWKRLYVCLRRSGLYCSTKGTSKEPRHLQLLADLEESNIFSLISGKKQYSAPTDHGLCIKVPLTHPRTRALHKGTPYPPTDHGLCIKVPIPHPPTDHGLCIKVPIPHPPTDHGLCIKVPTPHPPMDPGSASRYPHPTLPWTRALHEDTPSTPGRPQGSPPGVSVLCLLSTETQVHIVVIHSYKSMRCAWAHASVHCAHLKHVQTSVHTYTNTQGNFKKILKRGLKSLFCCKCF